MNILINKNDIFYMNRAIAQAKESFLKNEVPVGAVLVVNDIIIAEAHNQCEESMDATMHAEMIVIKEASKRLKSKYLEDAILYVTLEPCMMCAGAILNSKIKKVVFGAYDNEQGALCSVFDVLNLYGSKYKLEVIGGLFEDKCAQLILQFFKSIRKIKK